MLQRAASSAYSWWWASNIRTKQSKWLDADLQEMEERVKSMLKIVEEDGDSFARKAELYFKKRPELVQFVEETFKAYKALADRYDHISGELHKANHTIATAFPDQIQFDTHDEEDDNLPKAITSIDTSKIRKSPSSISQLSLISKTKENFTALRKLRHTRAAPQHSKHTAQEEIDKLQKGILVLQTEKEYIKSSYESGIARIWDIEKQIMDMQEEVFLLQDEFSADVVIEDDEARALMAATALKSCEASILKLEEQQKQSMVEAGIESERSMTAKEMIKAGEGSSSQLEEMAEVSSESRVAISTNTNSEEENFNQNVENLDSGPKSDFTKEHVDISTGTSVVELAEKINELVTKVINLELMTSSQTLQIKRVRSEADILRRNLKNSEEEKRTLIGDLTQLRDRLKQSEEELLGQQDFEQQVQEKIGMVDKKFTPINHSMGDFSVDMMAPKHHDHVSTPGISQEVTSLTNNNEVARAYEKEKALKLSQDNNFKFNQSSTGSSISIGSLEESQEIQKFGPWLEVQEKSDHAEIGSQSRDSLSKSQVGEQVVEISSSKGSNNVPPNKESQLQMTDTYRHSEASCHLEDDSVKAQVQEPQVEIISSQEDAKLHPSKEHSTIFENSFGHSVAGSQLGGKTRVEELQAEINLSPKDDDIYQNKESTSQHKKTFKDDSLISQVVNQKVGISTSQEGDNIHQKKESKPQPQENEISLNWLQSLVNASEGKEKIILAEYTSVLRSYKDAKKRLSEEEKKSQEYFLETTAQLRELKHANAMKDGEIHSLRKNLRSNFNHNSDVPSLEQSTNLQKPEGSEILRLKAATKRFASFDVSDRNPFAFKLPTTDGRQTTSVIEEKFRRAIDAVLEEHLEFWLRFSASFHNIQKFQTTFEDSQAEFKKLMHRKLMESTSNPSGGKPTDMETLLIDKKLRELKTELQVWMEQSMLLQGELESKTFSLSSIQEEISGTLEASLEDDVVKFAPYQAAKFHGELLNIQLENNKVAEELKVGMEHIRGLQAEVEKILSRLHMKIELPEPGSSSNHERLRHAPTKNRIPLRSFLFSAKSRRRQSVNQPSHSSQI